MSRRTTRRPGWTAGLAAVLLVPLSGSALHAGNTNLQTRFEASLRETFDSNIHLQDEEPDPANVAAAKADGFVPAQARRSSWVTSILPHLGLEYSVRPTFSWRASYQPDVSFYHSDPSEDYVAHRGTLGLGGKLENTTWDISNTVAYIHGGEEGLAFARPGDVPAVGGIPLRDRRAALVLRSGFRLTHTMGDWFIRPVASSYVHDFMTDLRYVPPEKRGLYVYENYLDRQDINGGLDIGYRALDRTHLVLGYRYGRQDQFDGPSGPGQVSDSPYDSAYHRVLVGLEGSPTGWLKVSWLMGPDFRDFSSAVKRAFPAFRSEEVLMFMDGSLTVQLSGRDTLSLRSTWYEQPAFSSFSMYQDIKHDLVWRRRWNSQLTSTLGFVVYLGDWQPPVHRNDWIFTPNGSLAYALSEHCTAELAYSYDWVQSERTVSSERFTEGREFTRHLATVGLRYTF